VRTIRNERGAAAISFTKRLVAHFLPCNLIIHSHLTLHHPPADWAAGRTNRAKVIHHCMVFHIHKVSARPGIGSAATITVVVTTSVGNEGGDGFATGHDLNRLSTIGRIVPILAKECNEVVALDIVVGLATNVGEITSVRASAVLVTFGTVGIGVVVGAVSAAWCVRGVGRPTGQLPARTASATTNRS
jgi:hypothetical protein